MHSTSTDAYSRGLTETAYLDSPREDLKDVAHTKVRFFLLALEELSIFYLLYRAV